MLSATYPAATAVTGESPVEGAVGLSSDGTAWDCCPGLWADQENHDADQQDPCGKQELEPLVLPRCQKQSQRDQIAEVGDPARQARGAKPYCAHREREHCRHPHGIDRDQRLSGAATKCEEVA